MEFIDSRAGSLSVPGHDSWHLTGWVNWAPDGLARPVGTVWPRFLAPAPNCHACWPGVVVFAVGCVGQAGARGVDQFAGGACAQGPRDHAPESSVLASRRDAHLVQAHGVPSRMGALQVRRPSGEPPMHAPPWDAPVMVMGIFGGGLADPQRWDEFNAPRREKVWRDIRALRAAPPGRADKGDRRAVFSAALEQSEQLFAAAAQIDYAARPILLFYGLSQAGRAIAAASIVAGQSEWRLKGHGIKADNLDSSPSPHELTVCDDVARGTSGSFVRLAHLLASASLPQATPLGRIWPTLPELAGTPLAPDPTGSAPTLRYLGKTMTERDSLATVYGPPWWFADTPSGQEVAAALDAYPSLAGHRQAADTTGYLLLPQQQLAAVWRAWDPPGNRQMTAFHESHTQAYRAVNDRWVFPALHAGEGVVVPILLWWAILYALSMLARYRPSDWTKHLDVDDSRTAVPLETVLGIALDTCPQLILHTIHTAAEEH